VSESPDAQRTRPGAHLNPPKPGAECAYVQDLAVSYVMAALEPDEHRDIDRHRNRCQDCDGVIAQVRETVSYLAFSVPQVAPPPRAKAALMARIVQPSQAESLFPRAAVAVPTPTLPSSRGALAPVPEGWEETNRARRRQLVGNPDRTRRFRPNWHLLATPLATVPLVLALGIVGVWAMNAQDRLSARSAEVTALNQQVDVLSDRVSTLSNTLADVDRFMVAANAVTYQMAATDGATTSTAVGQVIANPGTDEAMLVVKGLTGGHSTYEILLESNGGNMVSAGELPVKDGAGATVLKLSQPFASYRSIHVKPKSDDNSSGSSDSVSTAAPDALVGAIDPNLGNAGDTNVPDVGQSS
jgi:hypothetical protein